MRIPQAVDARLQADGGRRIILRDQLEIPWQEIAQLVGSAVGKVMRRAGIFGEQSRRYLAQRNGA